jgi:hypothetical protein
MRGPSAGPEGAGECWADRVSETRRIETATRALLRVTIFVLGRRVPAQRGYSSYDAFFIAGFA